MISKVHNRLSLNIKTTKIKTKRKIMIMCVYV